MLAYSKKTIPTERMTMTRAGYLMKNILYGAQLSSYFSTSQNRVNITKKDTKQWAFIFKLNQQMIVSTQKADVFNLKMSVLHCHSSDENSTFSTKKKPFTKPVWKENMLPQKIYTLWRTLKGLGQLLNQFIWNDTKSVIRIKKKQSS